MKRIGEQDITFRFGPVNQDEGDKHHRPGILERINNAIQNKQWDLEPRRGYARELFTNEFGGFQTNGTPDTLISTSRMQLLEGFGETIAYAWSLNDATEEWEQHAGSVYRPWPTSQRTLRQDRQAQPIFIRAGDYDWTFTRAASGYRFIVRHKDTGKGDFGDDESSGSASGIRKMAVVADATDVWVFYVDATTSAKCDRWSATTHNFVSSTTYQTIAGADLVDIDAHINSDNEIQVVVAGRGPASAGAGRAWHYSHSILNKTTAAALAAPAPVTTTGTAADGLCTGVSWLDHNGGDGFSYYAIWRPDGAGATELRVVKVTRSSNAIDTLSSQITTTAATNLPGAVGYVASSIPRVFATVGDATVSDDTYRVTPYDANSAALAAWSSGSPFLNAWAASKPFSVSSVRYIVTGTSNPLQNSYHLRLASGGANVIVQLERGLGPEVYDNADTPINSSGASIDGGFTRVAGAQKVYVDGSNAYFAAISDGGVSRIHLDFTYEYGPAVALRDNILAPGPIPFIVGPARPYRELTPLMSPATVDAAATTATPANPDDVAIQVIYALVDVDGTIDRSGPSIVRYIPEASIATPYPVDIPTYRHTLDSNNVVQIEIYITDDGGTTPVKRYVRNNDVFSDTITVDIQRGVYDPVDPEAIYTLGGALVAQPAPAARNVLVHRNRVIFSGTMRLGQIVPSLEMTGNSGPRFAPDLSSFWRDARYDITRMDEINWDQVAVFNQESVAVLSGAGPNGRAQGVYIVQSINRTLGLKNPRAAAKGDAGVYFQGSDDDKYLMTGPAITPIGIGAKDYTGEVSTVLYDPEDKKVIFFLQNETNDQLVLDYDRATPEQPFGQWYLWTSDGLSRAYAAVMRNRLPYHMSTFGDTMTYDDSGSYVDIGFSSIESYKMLVESGDLSPFDLGHQVRVGKATVYGTYVADTNLTLTLTGDEGLASEHVFTETRAVTDPPLQTRFKPDGLGRVQSVRFKIEVDADNGGAILSGMTLTVQDRGRKILRH